MSIYIYISCTKKNSNFGGPRDELPIYCLYTWYLQNTYQSQGDPNYVNRWYSYIHARHNYIHISTPYIHTCIHKHILYHIYIYTYIHTFAYIYTYIQTIESYRKSIPYILISHSYFMYIIACRHILYTPTHVKYTHTRTMYMYMRIYIYIYIHTHTFNNSGGKTLLFLSNQVQFGFRLKVSYPRTFR